MSRTFKYVRLFYSLLKVFMNYLKSTLLIIITLNIAAMVCSEYPDGSKTTAGSLWGAIGKSKFVIFFRKKLHTPINNAFFSSKFGSLHATPLYQQWTKEAQSSLGIAEEDHVGVKQRSPKSPVPSKCLAIARSESIYVNENSLHGYPIGAQRTVMHHEAAHIRYNDDSMQLLMNSTIFGCTIALLKRIQKAPVPKKYTGLAMLPVTAGSLVAAYSLNTRYHSFGERRADIAGCYATQCATCVHQYADHVNRYTAQGHGYLTHNETVKIAVDLEQQKKYCGYHKPL